MSKRVKIWLLIATLLLLLGSVVFASAMCFLKWDFSKLATSKYQTNSYAITEDYKDIFIDTNTANIIIVPSDDTVCYVECHEQKELSHSVEVTDGVLSIKLIDSRKWYEYIEISSISPKITVYLPKDEYNSLSIDTRTSDIKISNGLKFESVDICLSTGDICMSDIICGSINLKASTGSTYLSSVECASLSSTGSTGDISMTSLIATESIYIERDTGDVEFDGCDASKILISTNTGDIEGSLLTEKVFVATSDTGKVRVPSSKSGGICEITTDTGDIEITID